MHALVSFYPSISFSSCEAKYVDEKGLKEPASFRSSFRELESVNVIICLLSRPTLPDQIVLLLLYCCTNLMLTMRCNLFGPLAIDTDIFFVVFYPSNGKGKIFSGTHNQDL